MATTSIVQLTADLAASTASGAVSQLMPSGTVLPFAGRNVPAGWLLCDGSEISKTTYAALASALSYSASVTTTNASTSVTTASTAFISVGAAVTGTGIPAGAYVASITNATTFVISAAATAAGTVTATFSLYDRQINPTAGSAYAAPAAGNFRLPDYRGLFLRGTGTPYGTKSDNTLGAFDTGYDVPTNSMGFVKRPVLGTCWNSCHHSCATRGYCMWSGRLAGHDNCYVLHLGFLRLENRSRQ